MLIKLADIAQSNFDFEYDASELFKGLIPKLASSVIVKGNYNRTPEHEVEVVGTIEYDLDYPCSRCLAPIRIHYNIDYDEIYSAGDEDYKIINDVIDLSGMIEENIILNISTRVLCGEECKGLCPICGTNLNINKCKCNVSIDDDSIENSPFSVLKDITTGGAEDGSTKKKNF